MRYAPFLLLVLLLSACAGLPALPALPVATRTPTLISREQAIEIAVKIVSQSRPEVSGSLVTPMNIKAEQITLRDAMRRSPNGDVPTGYNPNAPVWYVTMDGLWRDEMPAPGVTVTPGYTHHATEIIDAVTGLEIGGSLRP